MSSDRTRSVVVLALAVLQIVSSPLTTLLGIGPDTGAVSDANRSLITPAGYAFSIWGLIYLASLAYATNQLRPSERTRPVQRRTGWWMALAFASSTVWVPIFATRTIWLSQIVILVLVVALITAAVRAARTGPAQRTTERALVRLPITLYLGWAVLAATAGFGVTFRSLGMPPAAAWVTVVSVLLLAAATLCCLWVVGRATALAAFAFTALWALVAVVVATPSDVVRVAAVLAAVVVAAALIVRTGRSDRKPTILLG
ncbi:hypothetical protein FHX74_000886 [Friedmanniella endophytica]|uniref:TspO and MBR related proteins n=1 Tax=Microlunatus kandeliicorticis TaxID=1759536 RepID=A0A7W3IQC8_9ACTN|nr:tryptophan-rich sensory protein [Microlunatus kandeliicorticis]MBA8793292.1 hypothetical protein [Microlunatus kandeliicorticis]